MALSKDGPDRFAATAASHVGNGEVPGLVALVAQGDQVHLVVIVLTQRMFESPQAPALHTELQAAALAATD